MEGLLGSSSLVGDTRSERTQMKTWTLAALIVATLALAGCGGSVSDAPPPAAGPSSAGIAALGDKEAPFDSTTAVSVIEAAKAA